MANRRLAPPDQQPKEFSFTAENAAWAKQQIAKYPAGRQQSAIIPLLWRAQEQNGGWLPEAAIRVVPRCSAWRISAARSRDLYTMFLLSRAEESPRSGLRHHALRAARRGAILDVCKKRIHHDPATLGGRRLLMGRGRVPRRLRQRADGADLSDTYEDLTAGASRKCSTNSLRCKPKPGPQIDRQLSAPVGGATTLKSVKA
jgi:NADH-quinone oxidoreductase subunit E